MMSVKFELDNGELKEYSTWQPLQGSDGYSPEKPYRTKCGLSFKDDPSGGTGACGHLECAVCAAKDSALSTFFLLCFFMIMMISVAWYENIDIHTMIQDNGGTIILVGLFSILEAISPIRRWLELREYKNKGTIHGIDARRL